MTRDDIEAVVANEKAAYDHPWSRKLLEQSLEGRDHCFVCVTDGIVAGHGIVSAVADEGHVLNICLAPRWQGRGLGRELLDWLVEDLRAAGAATVFLEVRRSNFAAVALYESAGFNQIAIRPDYYPAAGGLHEDARVMALSLDLDWPPGPPKCDRG